MTTSCALRGCECCGLVSEVREHDDVRCPRCGTRLHVVKPKSLQRSAACLITALVLYVPSNVLPVMTTRSALDGEHAHTLLGGIAELWANGSWELAVIVFAASIAVPLTKMVALTLLIETALWRSTWRQRERATLYRMLGTIGHWSMLDVYVVVMLAGMVQFGALGGVEAEPGLLAFGAVVVLTMLAVSSFDPRLIWPQGEEDGHGRAG
jgi:paraquat-inducible protein A